MILSARRRRPRDGQVLEIGVGAGLNLPRYLNAEKVVGLDPDPKQRRRARRAVASATCPVTLLEADAESLPFSGANRRSLDAIRRQFAVERLWEQWLLVQGTASPITREPV
ncbi:MAG: class I SAM-dependent methyltransferase [Solirubrobacterales bacterium]|nr:class I SAM-dependent methyltransferase [Solirubrobacterales bacterium]